MGNSKCFFAVDLGATSGRTIVGTLSDGKIKLEEITRFPNLSLIHISEPTRPADIFTGIFTLFISR